MPNEEDYLDSLLESISQKKTDIDAASAADEKRREERLRGENRLDPGDDFLKETGLSDYRPDRIDHRNLRQTFSESSFLNDFERELTDNTADDFIRKFEEELELEDDTSEQELNRFLNDEEEKAPSLSSGPENFDLSKASEAETGISADEALLGNIDEIVKNAKKQVEEGPLLPEDGPLEPVLSKEPDLSADMIAENNAAGDGSALAPEAFAEEAPETGGEADGGSSDEAAAISDDLLSEFEDGAVTGSSAEAAETGGTAATAEEPDLSDEDAAAAAADLEELFPDGDTSAKEVSLMDESGEGQDLMNILGDDGEFSDIGDLLSADDNAEELPEAAAEFESSAEAVASGSEDPFGDSAEDPALSDLDGGEKKGGLGGIIGKIKGIFAGLGKKKKDGEEEDTAEENSSSDTVDIAPKNPSAEELMSEDDDLLKEFGEEPPSDEAAEPEAEEEGKGGKKKKGKKEKKDKKEKTPEEIAQDEEKAQQKKDKAAAAAEKKQKKAAAKQAAKEADTSPVIPKKAIVIFAVFGISIAVLVIVFTKSSGYARSLEEAVSLYEAGNYSDAYAKFYGMELKGDDTEYLQKSRVLGTLDLRLKQYNECMKLEKYDMALDDLIIGTITYENNKNYVGTLTIAESYDRIGQKIEGLLEDQFGVSVEQAKDIYNSRNRVEYSVKLSNILINLGLTERSPALVKKLVDGGYEVPESASEDGASGDGDTSEENAGEEAEEN